MKKRNYLKIIMILLLLFGHQTTSSALDVATHAALNTYIAQNSLNGFSLGTYLQDQLGFENREEETFNSLSVWQLLRDGGRYEDLPVWYLRYLSSVNHFHDPLATSLSQAGFTGVWGTGILSGKSAILWSQSALGAQSPGGHYSWYDVRDYYYRALSSPGQGARDAAFANTFCGLGQLMHLVQDMSVLEHARNDGHYANDWGAKI